MLNVAFFTKQANVIEGVELAKKKLSELKASDLPEIFTHSIHSNHDVIRNISWMMDKGTPTQTVAIREYTAPFWSRRVIGYAEAKGSELSIYLNTKKFFALSRFDYANNFAHEMMHLLGYQHQGNFADRNGNHQSVPYVVGNVVESLIRKDEGQL